MKFQSSNNLKSSGFKLDSSSKSFAKFIEAANFEHIPTGAKARINAKITASVSRAGVLAGGGKLARLGAKFSTRAVPYVGTALLAHDVYETFKEDIQRGYQYDPETDKFAKVSG
ncbi:IgG-binding virulence factor TspB family protein [Neisseria meningitidis]